MPNPMMALLNAQIPGQGVDNAPPPDAGVGQEQTSPPAATGMTTPEPAAGQREAALINIHMALDLMEKALGGLGAESPEGATVMKALGALTKVFGEQGRGHTAELAPAEIMQLLNSLPQAGGAKPEDQVAQGQPAIPGMAPGGNMPPTPPPGMGAPGGGMPANPGAA